MWFVTSALAAVPFDRSFDVSPDVAIELSVPCGSVKVTGSERSNVRISGTTARGEQIEVRASDGHLRLITGTEQSADCVDLVIEAPAGASLEAESVSSNVTVAGLRGAIEIATVSGAVTVSGAPSSVEIGNVCGKVVASIAGGRIEVSTVSGSIELTGTAPFADVELASVSGEVTAALALLPSGSLEAATHSGPLRVKLPPDLAATLSLGTFSGRIRNAFGTSDGGVVGGGSSEVELATFSGNLDVEKR